MDTSPPAVQQRRLGRARLRPSLQQAAPAGSDGPLCVVEMSGSSWASCLRCVYVMAPLVPRAPLGDAFELDPPAVLLQDGLRTPSCVCLA
jgi:hypothetical protein